VPGKNTHTVDAKGDWTLQDRKTSARQLASSYSHTHTHTHTIYLTSSIAHPFFRLHLLHPPCLCCLFGVNITELLWQSGAHTKRQV